MAGDVAAIKTSDFAAGGDHFLVLFTSFGVILILGGLRQATIETEIFRHAVVRGDLLTSSSLAMIQIVAVLCLVAVTSSLERRANTNTQMVRSVYRPHAAGYQIRCYLIHSALSGSPLVVMIERSLRVGEHYGVQNYRALFEKIPQLPTTSAQALGNLFSMD